MNNDKKWEKCSAFKDLIGNNIDSVYITICKQALIFILKEKKEPLIYFAKGDCCSDSWFEHFNGYYSLLSDSIVEGVEEIYLGEVMPSLQDCDQLYGFKIKIKDEPSIFIEMRNSSNGYYGGDVVKINNYKELNKHLEEKIDEEKGLPLNKIDKDF